MHIQFHVLTQTELAGQPPAHFTLACQLCADLYRADQRVFVYCATQQDAELLDEVLWRFDADRFVPHNLVGEGPARGAPVEISWLPPRSGRSVLLNLSPVVPPFYKNFQQIIEFVPTDEAAKAMARQRFKHYRQLGFSPETIQAG